MPEHSAQSAIKFESLQALRGIAALMVVLVHQPLVSAEMCFLLEDSRISIFFARTLSNFLKLGYVGVDLFFVLSGFIITWVSWNQFGNWKNIGSFLIKRVFRIYPIYLVALAFHVIGNLIFYDPAELAGFTSNLFYNLTLLPVSGKADFIVGVAWSLVCEVFFYMLFALCLPFARSKLKYVLIIWSLIIIVVNGLVFFPVPEVKALQWLVPEILNQPVKSYIGLILSPHNLFFVFGAFVALFARKGLVLPWPTFVLIVASIGLMFAAALHLTLVHRLTDHGVWRAIYLLIPCVLIVAAIVARELKSSGVPAGSPLWLMQIGDASYSLYLLHMLFIRFFRKLWIGMPGEAQFYWMLLGVATSVIVSIMVAKFTYEYIERPAIDLGRAFQEKLKVLV